MSAKPFNVLVIGSGGREHALCWAIRKSALVGSLYCAPGNAGIARDAKCVDLTFDSLSVIAFCRQNKIGLVVVGPEGPLVAGLIDDLLAAGIKAFGPTKAAAQLEGSKVFTKELCVRAGIPTAAAHCFAQADAAKEHVRRHGVPVVVKADGLAAGKGVIVAGTVKEALDAIDVMFSGTFGVAGATILLEEKLIGEEVSFMALVDGTTIVPLVSAQDHKRAFDGDRGPNTGGMGAYSPAPVMTDAIQDRAMHDIMRPAVTTLAREGHPYKGVLYAGLMITAQGPKLIEFNCRFGDPECQVILMRLKSDLVPALLASIEGTLKPTHVAWREDAALTVVMAARGYPGAYMKGSEIKGLDRAVDPNIKIFHAGTQREGHKIVAAGGRVLNITALGATVAEARASAYRAVDAIDWPEGFCRRDIGFRALQR